jgi:XTP/dITP diphosphohydrolase
MDTLIVATRSAHKLREIRELMGPIPGIRLIELEEAGISWSPEEDEVEAFETFEDNALAKARYFAARATDPVLADDSGLCVDALDGAPGVRSKRFSGRSDLGAPDLDQANNQRLLEALQHVAVGRRSAHYVCAIALVLPDGREEIVRGTVDGEILKAPRGSGGFGYDPLFHVEMLGASFAEVDAATKNRISHRAAAVAALRPRLVQLLEAREQTPSFD